ncbi:MAG: peptidase M24, partial [Actinomycetota bacterium]|nr:peptidase M24 [Actinomycetota bacterium]
PRGEPLGRLAMLVACARRAGLVASLTRFVSFGPLRPELADAFERLLRVDVAFNVATRPGVGVGEVFAAGVAAYRAQGFDEAEWRLHHQGGPTGYEPRDYLATAESAPAVERAQAFAWNPSAPSLKSEDTILATPDGPEILTVDPTWPTQLVDGLPRPSILTR